MRNIFKMLIRKWNYSFVGLWTAFKEENSLWAYLLLLPLVIVLGVWLDISTTKWAIALLTLFMVITVEVINTALEATVDAISFQYNIKVKKIKDVASGATLVMTTGMVVSLLVIFIPEIMGVL